MNTTNTTKRPTPSVCLIGEPVEILPAYSCETDSRSIWDEVAGCAGTITGVRSDGYVMVQVRNGDEWEIATSRLSFRRPS